MTDDAQPEPFVSDYLSVLLQAWTMALEPHLEQLLVTRPTSPPSPRERSHAIATVIFSAFAIESDAARIRVIRNWVPPKTADGGLRDALLTFLRDQGPHLGLGLVSGMSEVLLLRNALAHNHIWLMRGTLAGETYTAEAVEALARREDWLFQHHATADGRHTKRHRLNLVPELVGYNDARKVLGILVAALDALARLDVPNMPSAADSTIYRLRGHRTLRSFHELPRRRARR